MNKPFQPDLFSLDQTPIAPFLGTDNPRQLRALYELMNHDFVSRVALGHRAGCINTPDLVDQLRKRNLQIPCVKVPVKDRDGRTCRVGEYYLTPLDRMLIEQWAKRTGAKV